LNGEGIFNAQLLKYSTTIGLKNAILSGKFPDRQHFLPHVPKRLRTLIRKAIGLSPTDRFDSATSFADALGRIQVRRDWSTQIAASGEMTWTGVCAGKTPLTVELKGVKKGWTTEVYTNGGKSRAKGRESCGKFA
jgi:hypothetical protein